MMEPINNFVNCVFNRIVWVNLFTCLLTVNCRASNLQWIVFEVFKST